MTTLLAMEFDSGTVRALVACCGLIIVVFTVLRMTRMRHQRRASGDRAPGRTPAGLTLAPGELHRAGEDLSEVLVQLREVAREVEARLDNRVRLARTLLDQLEECGTRLEKLLDNAAKLGVAPRPAAPRAASPRADAARPDPARPEPLLRPDLRPDLRPEFVRPEPVRREPLREETERSGREQVGPSSSSGSPIPDPSTFPPPGSLRSGSTPLDTTGAPAGDAGELPIGGTPEMQRVGELAAQGLNALEIARRVQRPVGEVELMLGLRRHANPSKSP